MGLFRDFRRSYKLVKSGQDMYAAGMQFIERIKHRIQLVVAIVITWAVVVLGLAIYVAVKVSS